MHFGLFLEWPNAGARPWRDAFEEAVAQARLAEECGFDFCLIAEHHFSDYGIAPSPILEALAILRATSTLRVGTGVAVLPEWQPLRLAEEMAVADQLSGGRFIAGVGRGFVPFEQERFGVDVSQGRAAFEESLEVLLKAWTEEDFTFDGRFVRVPRPTTVLPRSWQRPYPPLWLAGASAESIELVGRLGMTPITSVALGPEQLAAQRAQYAAARARHGRAHEPLEVVAQGHTYVAATEAEVRAILPEARWQRRAVPALLAERVSRGVLNVQPLAEEPDDDALLRSQLFGTPDQLIARLRALGDAGVTHVSMLMTFGGLDHERVLRSIRLMGEAVIPALR
jgi:alkanesulfonate monooxygenase SsuD/methylene tetrahydromethanopterin reductase-like flavin-dependent oxidoreductase (luciferase family)